MLILQRRFIDVLGNGSFGTVKLAIDRETNRRVAIKVIDKERVMAKKKPSKVDELRKEPPLSPLEKVWREIDVLKRVRHENIVSLNEVYDSPKKIYIVMDYASGKQ